MNKFDKKYKRILKEDITSIKNNINASKEIKDELLNTLDVINNAFDMIDTITIGQYPDIKQGFKNAIQEGMMSGDLGEFDIVKAKDALIDFYKDLSYMKQKYEQRKRNY